MNYVVAFAIMFISVFFKGFQFKNIIAAKYGWMFLTSYAIAFADVVLIGLIVKAGWQIGVVSATGGALGMVVSTWLHNKLSKRG